MNALPACTLAALGLAAFLAAGCAGTDGSYYGRSGDQVPVASIDASATAKDAGVRVESLRLTAADYLLDLRFRITDPERAAPFFSRKTEVQLVDPASGARLAVPNTPKLGKLRQVARKDMTGRSYFILFANPGKYIKPGTRLTLVAGDVKLENLLVEGAGAHHGENL